MPTMVALMNVLMTASLSMVAQGEEGMRDYTCFQTAAPYAPEIDIGSDVAIVYGVGADFRERVDQWRAKGYAVSMMTGISWGNYGEYYETPDGFKKEEVQTTKTGRLLMHGHSTTVGYNVPTDTYVEFIKRYVEPAVDAGVDAVFMEEPEFWAEAGWSEAFKSEWERFYGEPWQPPDSSVDAQYRASKLKYEMYFRALREVFRHIKARARAQGRDIECHVPTHSMINYSQWRIVSPESYLMELEEMDGYIAQVWTGTARSKNIYRGEVKERTFETAFLEYGQMLGMVRPTGRKVWFLHDPIEDNPNYSWNNYKLNYECTVIASLLWPEVHRFEVMPWPNRIFQGRYPKVDLDTTSEDREGIPAEYATQILTVINALNDMKQDEIRYDTGTRGIGVVVSDTMMFQRAAPSPSDPHLGSFFALAMPFVKHGIPLEVVQLENALHPSTLAPYSLLLLTYEGQKPLKAAYNTALAEWVRNGGCLLYIGDDSDPYHAVREWWNEQGATSDTPHAHLFRELGITQDAHDAPQSVGKGFVRVLWERPRKIQTEKDGADKVIKHARELLDRVGVAWKQQNYLLMQRGPYVIAAVLDESVSDEPLTLNGHYVDLFDPLLPVVRQRTVQPNERALLYDMEWAKQQRPAARVLAAAARVREEVCEANRLRFVTRGPQATTARMRILLPATPLDVRVHPLIPLMQEWDHASGTLRLTFDNQAEDVAFEVRF